jgi:hypothetical protein
MVPQLFAAEGNRSYPDLWAVSSDPGYKTLTNLSRVYNYYNSCARSYEWSGILLTLVGCGWFDIVLGEFWILS